MCGNPEGRSTVEELIGRLYKGQFAVVSVIVSTVRVVKECEGAPNTAVPM